MIETAQTLYSFWNSFGIPAYPEYSVPDEAELPYITYDLLKPDWREASSYTVKLWYRNTSYSPILLMANQISKRIGEGIRIPMDHGAIFLFKDANFMQMVPQEADESETMKVAYLSMIIHVLA